MALLFAARVAPGGAGCACDVAHCVDPDGYMTGWPDPLRCVVAQDGDLKVVGYSWEGGYVLGWILNHPNLQGPPRPGGPREAHY